MEEGCSWKLCFVDYTWADPTEAKEAQVWQSICFVQSNFGDEGKQYERQMAEVLHTSTHTADQKHLSH